MKLKAMSFGIIIGAALTAIVLTLSSFAPQETSARYAMMKTYEYAAMYDSKIIIVYENGEVEEIMLEKAKYSNFAINMQKINETLNRLSKKGYKMISSSGEVTFGCYIFEKK